MADRPLVTIVVPSFNAHVTLPRAFSSVLAQTCDDWECLVVDDGSTVSPFPLIRAMDNERIQLITLDQNRGRAIARQAALERARGKYLAMLDADDWMFPTRIADQVAFIDHEPDLTLVSSSLAITNHLNEIVAVRQRVSNRSQAERVAKYHLERPLPFHPSSMIRMSVAKQYAYHSQYRVAEDYDFLLKVLVGRDFALLDKIHYAYAESANLTLGKMLASNAVVRDVLRRNWRIAPSKASWLIGSTYVKSSIYWAAFATGFDHHLVARRSSPPSSAEIQAFEQARAVVESTCLRTFGKQGNDH